MEKYIVILILLMATACSSPFATTDDKLDKRQRQEREMQIQQEKRWQDMRKPRLYRIHCRPCTLA